MKKCLIIPVLTILVACSETPNPNSEVKQESQPSPKEQKQVEEGTLIPRSIEGDKGKYYLLDKKLSKTLKLSESFSLSGFSLSPNSNPLSKSILNGK